MQPTLRSLYLCYLSIEDPLVQTQVVAYLEGLVDRGHTVHLLTFEPNLGRPRELEIETDLRHRGIAWHSVRYHKRPSLPATVYDALLASVVAVRVIRRNRLDAIHARNHVPAATALIAQRMTGCRLIFDIRGLMAEQYVDAGSWTEGDIAYRITRRIQALAIRRAAGIVTLTERARLHLFGSEPPERSYVIPCCADLERLTDDGRHAGEVSAELGLGDRPVMLYVGKLTGRYMTAEMVRFFSVAAAMQPSLALLVLTQEDPHLLESTLAREGIDRSDYRITRAEPGAIGRYLALGSFGIFLYRPGPSDLAVSPTKVGEYLGAGIPVVSSPGVGDTEDLLLENDVGVVVHDFAHEVLDASARAIMALAASPGCDQRCRACAEANLSLKNVGIPRYDRLYRDVAGTVEHEGPSKR